MAILEKLKLQFEEDEKEGLTDVKLKNQLNTVRTNKAKVQKAVHILTNLGFIEEPELDSEGNITISEIDSFTFNITEGLDSYIKVLNNYEEVIVNILEEPVPTVEYKLKVYLQNSKKTVRYYYESTYLFSAPLELYEEITIEFNRLMNEEPKLTLAEVKEKLTSVKNLMVIFRNDSEVPTSENVTEGGLAELFNGINEEGV